MRKIIVIGRGIGGLCTALMLQRSGFDVRLFDRVPSIKPVGAGLGVGSNALAALYKAGVGQEIEQKGNPLHYMEFQNEHGERLNQMDFTHGPIYIKYYIVQLFQEQSNSIKSV